MQGTIRTFSAAVRQTVLTRLRVLLDGVTAGFGGGYELDVEVVTSAVINDPAIAEIARRIGAGGGQCRSPGIPRSWCLRTSRNSPGACQPAL